MWTHNSKGEHHGQFVARVKPARDCTQRDCNFGGGCFNCGFQPTQEDPRKTQPKESRNGPEDQT